MKKTVVFSALIVFSLFLAFAETEKNVQYLSSATKQDMEDKDLRAVRWVNDTNVNMMLFILSYDEYSDMNDFTFGSLLLDGSEEGDPYSDGWWGTKHFLAPGEVTTYLIGDENPYWFAHSFIGYYWGDSANRFDFPGKLENKDFGYPFNEATDLEMTAGSENIIHIRSSEAKIPAPYEIRVSNETDYKLEFAILNAITPEGGKALIEIEIEPGESEEIEDLLYTSQFSWLLLDGDTIIDTSRSGEKKWNQNLNRRENFNSFAAPYPEHREYIYGEQSYLIAIEVFKSSGMGNPFLYTIEPHYP